MVYQLEKVNATLEIKRTYRNIVDGNFANINLYDIRMLTAKNVWNNLLYATFLFKINPEWQISIRITQPGRQLAGRKEMTNTIYVTFM